MIGNKDDKLFTGHYEHWRDARIQKIVSIFGEEFFKNKTILELGCGWGDIGLQFRKLGANVTFAEGREEHLPHIKEHSPDSEIIQLDQDKKWNLEKKFDLIIHMGVLYHLTNWKQDLISALSHTNKMILETVVANDSSNSFEYTNREEGWDQSIHKTSIRPSAAYIEKALTELGFKFTRFDDSDINSHKHRYDWKVDNKAGRGERGQNGANYRRFWLIEK